MSKEIKNSIVKPTFSAVHKSQQLLIGLLRELIKNNRCLNPKEYEYYHNCISSSTLGLGSSKTFRIYIDGKIFTFGNVEFVARWLSDQTKNEVAIPPELGEIGSKPVDIKVFWKKLLEHLYYVFPIALETAIAMSKEIPGDTGFKGELVK